MEFGLITPRDMLVFKSKSKSLYAMNSDKEKAFYMCFHGGYEVWEKGNLVKSTKRAIDAVDFYNNI